MLGTTSCLGGLGCAVEPGDGFSFGASSAQVPGSGDESESGGSDEGDETSDGPGDGGEDGSTGVGDEGDTSGDSDPSTSTTDDPSGDESTGAASDTTGGDESTGGVMGDQPDFGMYAHCIMGNECSQGMGCLTNNAQNDGFCTSECVAPGDTSGCDPSPGGEADLGCIVVTGLHLCALDCTGGKSCPGNMTCTTENDDNGPIEVCM